MKTAVLTGIRGQDASYLAEFLLAKGYKVVGIERRTSAPDYTNIQHLLNRPNFVMEQGDITDFGSIARILKEYKPDEFYNLAAQSFVGSSWDQPIATTEINYTGVCNCLEAIRLLSYNTKFFQASTSEVYGDVITNVQNENTPARPRSPYGASKYAAESMIKVYRDSYNIFACFARSFNHESPRRGKQFVTRKITNAIGEMFNIVESKLELDSDNQSKFEYALSQELIQPIHLGNLKAERDWSHAQDIVYGMWLMMQQDKPEDFVLASGSTRSIREFLDYAFDVVGIYDWEELVVIDPKFYRPAEVNTLCGDYSKAKKKLGWEPKISFEELVKEMVKSDIKASALMHKHSKV